MKIVIIGLTITSCWHNDHAQTYRSLVSGLAQYSQDVLFLEQDRSWYAAHRDLPDPPYCRTDLYADHAGLASTYGDAIAAADMVIVGSFVADGPAVCQFVQAQAKGLTAFYDLDTPGTMAAMAQSRCEYITPELVPGFHLYLSATGGPTLRVIERRFGARAARALYCSTTPDRAAPDPAAKPGLDLGYIGGYAIDRQPKLDALLLTPARLLPDAHFAVVGPEYPSTLHWPANVLQEVECPADEQRAFYASQRFTLNLTRPDVVRAGFTPSLQLFQAAACGTPVISDPWPGLDTLFRPDSEILIAYGPEDVVHILRDTTEDDRIGIAARARTRIMQAHTGRHRAAELLAYARESR